MTRKEWMKKHYPAACNEKFLGGIRGCPKDYPLLCYMDQSIHEGPPSIRHSLECKTLLVTCEQCWNQEMEVSE
jgi:hypothetical protein